MAYTITFDLVEACNLACASCLQGIKGSSGKRFPLPLLRDCIEHLTTHFDIHRLTPFNWSEPTLSRDILEFLDLAASLPDLQTAFSSNMNAPLSDVLVDRLSQIVDLFIFSVSGLDQATYQRYHRKGDIRKVVANIDRLSAAIAASGRSPTVSLGFGIHRYNPGELTTLVPFCRDRNITLQPTRYYLSDMEDVLTVFRGGDIPKERYELLYPSLEEARADIASHLTPGQCRLMHRDIVLDPDGRLMLCCGTRIGTGRDIRDLCTERELVAARLRNDFCRECFETGLPGYFEFTPARKKRLLDALYTHSPENAAACDSLPWFQCQMATVHLANKDYAAAQRVLATAIRLDPLSALSHFQMGFTLAQQHEHAAAVAAVRQAVAIDAAHPAFHHLLGHQLLRLGDLDEAERALLRALALHPGHPPSENVLRVLRATRGTTPGRLAPDQE